MQIRAVQACLALLDHPCNFKEAVLLLYKFLNVAFKRPTICISKAFKRPLKGLSKAF
jgi:hypothetical protein